MRDIQKIIKRFEKSSNKQKVKLLKSLYIDEAIELLPFLYKVIENDNIDVDLKIDIAKLLGASKINEAVPVLFYLVNNPKYNHTSGSFLYILKDLDCTKYFIDIVELMCTGVFEVYYHSYEIFLLTLDKVSKKEISIAKQILINQKKIEDDKIEMLDRFSRINYINVALEKIKQIVE